MPPEDNIPNQAEWEATHEPATPEERIETASRAVELCYTNYKGFTHMRRVTPKRFYFGATEHHTEPQWLMECFDEHAGLERTFSLADIHLWRPDQEQE